MKTGESRFDVMAVFRRLADWLRGSGEAKPAGGEAPPEDGRPPPAVTGKAGGHTVTGQTVDDSELVDEASEESFPASDPPAYR